MTQRKELSSQIAGNDDDSNDLRWFSGGIRIVRQLRKPKKKKKSHVSQ